MTPHTAGVEARAVNDRMAFLLLATILPRLLHVWAPIAGWHSWRQADTAAISRGFLRGGMNILLPAVDWAGAGPGYVECEFPLFQYIVACVFRIGGVHVIYGRVIAVVFSCCATIALFRLTSRNLGTVVGMATAVCFSWLPVNIYIGSAFMPESLMLYCSVAAVDRIDRWSRGGAERDRWLSAAFLATAISVKLPELFLGAPILYLIWRRLGWRLLLDFRTWLYAAAALLPPALWYWHAHQLGRATGLSFGIWEAGSDKWGNMDLLLSGRFYTRLFADRLFGRHLAYAGTPLLVLGVVRLRGRADLRLFRWWAFGGIIYLLIVARGNLVHDYYQLPVLFPLCVWLGAGAAVAIDTTASPRMRYAARVLVMLFVTLSVGYNAKLLKKECRGAGVVETARIIQSIVPEGSRIIVLDDGDPTFLYHIDRRGWHGSLATLRDDWIFARRDEGASYLVVLADQVRTSEGRATVARLGALFPDRSRTRGINCFDLRAIRKPGTQT